MNKISTLLMLGRSLRIRVIATCQRPDASVFKNGSRLNFGIIIVLGASIKVFMKCFYLKNTLKQ